ncbi:MAG: hypothetical protein IPM37_09995 [Hahellaceae bacterium]|nr:hypothetical protein [Hahellaceae bacterium]
MNLFFLVMACFMSVYGIWVNAVPGNSILFLFLCSLLFLFIYLCFWRSWRFVIKVGRLEIGVFAIHLFIICYLAIVSLYLGCLFPDLLSGQVMAFLSAFVAMVIGSCFRHYDFRVVVLGILFITTIQACAILASFLSESFRTFADAAIGEAMQVVDGGNWRLRGFSNVAGSSLSIIQGLGLISAAYLVFKDRSQRRLVLPCVPIIFVSILFTGKSGLLSIPLAIIFWMLVAATGGRFSVSGIFEVFKAIILSASILFVLYYLYSNFFVQNTVYGTDALAGVFVRASEEYLVLAGGDRGDTLSYLTYSFNLPDREFVWLFGDPRSWEELRYSAVRIGDSGYLRLLWGYGIFVSTIYYALFVVMLISAASMVSDRVSKIYIYIVYGWIFVMQFKEPYMLMPCFVFILTLLCFSSGNSVCSLRR